MMVSNSPAGTQLPKIKLRIQDPGDTATLYLLDAIAQAASGAQGGQLVFAFATVAGVEMLLSCDPIRKLAISGKLEVIVGIDAITNRQTLEMLQGCVLEHPGLRPKIFWNFSSGIFHPKFCRFWNSTNETWIVGSGNLTPRGLRDNYECFVVLDGRRPEFDSIRKTFLQFLENHASDIRDIDDKARERASKNKFNQPVGEIEPSESQSIPKRSYAARSRDSVLIAEIPKGGSRWQQANFDLETAHTFFGVEPNSDSIYKDLFFNELDNKGTRKREEVRRFTFTRSKNLRVQLAAKSGSEYPKTGRPIAVFWNAKVRHFLYQLLLPGETGFRELRKLLARRESGEVRRHITDMGELSKAFPQSRLW